MSWKKKRVKKNQNRKRYFIILSIICISIVFLFLLLFLCLKLVNKEEKFKIEPRLDSIDRFVLDEDSYFDSMGWIRVQGTNIDYPIIQASREALNADDFAFPVNLEDYSWSLNTDTKFHNHIEIMGHNIFNLSSQPKIKSSKFHRFESLMAFVYYDFAKKNQYVQLSIDGKEYIYKIFAVEFIPTAQTTSFLSVDDYSKKDQDEYIQYMLDNSIYDYRVKVDGNDDIISLITCTRFFGIDEDVQFYVNARLLHKGENTNITRVNKSSKYKSIEKKLKGDGQNESDNEEDSL